MFSRRFLRKSITSLAGNSVPTAASGSFYSNYDRRSIITRNYRDDMASYSLISVFRDKDLIFLQPNEDDSESNTLGLDLTTGSIAITKESYYREQLVPSEALAILGICSLQNGVCLAVVTDADEVAQISGAPIYEVKACKLFYSESSLDCKEDVALISLIESALCPSRGGRGLYFSHSHDLTSSQQRISVVKAKEEQDTTPMISQTDPKFLWNRSLTKPFVDAQAYRFVAPFIWGFVKQIKDFPLELHKSSLNPSSHDANSSIPNANLNFPPNSESPITNSPKLPRNSTRDLGTFTLIARRGVDRAGTRQWRRGADAAGHVANFVETEQILAVPSRNVTSSFVQVRGSIPLLWTQLPNMNFKPTTVIASNHLSSLSFDKHCAQLLERYEAVVAVNLINHGGTEGKLERLLRLEVTRYLKSFSGLRYIAFDFHHECRNGRYSRVSLLWDRIQSDFDQFGHYLAENGKVVTQQVGTVRTNCMDCLDRTNVVQGMLARKNLETVLARLGYLPSTPPLSSSMSLSSSLPSSLPSSPSSPTAHPPLISLPLCYPALEREFKNIWADHGDVLAEQYAGTGAMKSGFTRTGRRTTIGFLDDCGKAVVRYYYNNFRDGVRQDSIDLITGAFSIPKGGVFGMGSTRDVRERRREEEEELIGQRRKAEKKSVNVGVVEGRKSLGHSSSFHPFSSPHTHPPLSPWTAFLSPPSPLSFLPPSSSSSSFPSSSSSPNSPIPSPLTRLVQPQVSPLIPIAIGVASMAFGAHQAGQILQTLLLPSSLAMGGGAGLMGGIAGLLSAVKALEGGSGEGRRIDGGRGDGNGGLSNTSHFKHPFPFSSEAISRVTSSIGSFKAAVLAGGGAKAIGVHAFQMAAIPMAFGFGILTLIVKNGKRLVNQPVLCPELAITTIAPSALNDDSATQ